LNARHPQVLKLIMDSLRYWIEEMHVDGFRFDLASTLARELHDVDRLSAFFDIIHQDPVISQVKLIAEPWDVGDGGYQVGNFPAGWAEWNGRYRDTVRRYWKSDDGQLSDLGYRLTGSSDLYDRDGRRPSASINFVTAHDGFTLQRPGQLQRQAQRGQPGGQQRRNERQLLLEHGRRRPHRRFRNHPTPRAAEAELSRDAALIARRADDSGGDEISRTQNGNNNAYCQDDEITWVDWRLDGCKISLMEFTQKLIQFRRDHPSLHRRKFYQDRAIRGTEEKDIVWLRPDGQEMSDEEWGLGWVRCLGLMLNGETIGEVDEAGEPSRTTRFSSCSIAITSRSSFSSPSRQARKNGRSSSIPTIRSWLPTLASPNRARPVDLVPLSLVVCREPSSRPVFPVC
jgi:isoamylase